MNIIHLSLRRVLSLSGFCILLVLATKGFAQEEEVVTLSTTVTGNQEQPKVLYIVPWKQTKDNRILEKGLESRLTDVFDHVEPNEHRRALKYLDVLADGGQSEESSH